MMNVCAVQIGIYANTTSCCITPEFYYMLSILALLFLLPTATKEVLMNLIYYAFQIFGSVLNLRQCSFFSSAL